MAQTNSIPVLTISKMLVFEMNPTEVPQSTRPYLLELPSEIRLHILQYLLPDLEDIPHRLNSNIYHPRRTQLPRDNASNDSDSHSDWDPLNDVLLGSRRNGYLSLRHDGESCHPAIMQVCRRIYEECHEIIFSPSRTFEVLLDHSISATLFLLSTRSWHLGSTVTSPFGTMSNPEVDQLKNHLGSIKSMRLELPSYRIPFSSSVRPCLSAFVSLIRRLFPEKCPLTRLTINVPLPRERRLDSSQYEPVTLDEKLEGHQASLKWMLQPLQGLSGFEHGKVTFLVNDMPIEEACRDITPDFVDYTKRLAEAMSQECEYSRHEMPLQLYKLARMVSCNASLRRISGIVELEGPPQVHIRRRPISARSLDSEATDDPHVLLWDNWETGALEELESEYKAVKGNWDKLNTVMRDACLYVENMLDTIGTSKGEETAQQPNNSGHADNETSHL